jgi:hypothetical protein
MGNNKITPTGVLITFIDVSLAIRPPSAGSCAPFGTQAAPR